MRTKRKARKTASTRAIDVTPPPQVAPQPAQRKRSSLLATAVEQWTAAGGLLPASDQSAGLLAAYRGAHNAVLRAKQDLEARQAAESATVLALARAYGARSLRIDGVIHDFASRGDAVFFRRRQADIVDVA